MIAFVEHPEALASFSGNAFACRIRATAAAYGFTHPFARFWVQGREAALCLLDDVMILDARAGADFDELAAFLPAAGARTVLCSAEAAQALPFPRRATGEIMALRERAAPVEEAEILWDPSPRLLYPLLCASQTASFLPPPFEPFYLDLSHRTRHGAARSAAIRAGDSLAACAICSAKTEESAVLSAVAVRPDVRRRGLGARVVLALAASLPVDTIYIFRASGENEAFYRTLGFTG
ncbi:MAG: GNAT family N-acetyltransferase, partial [Anaeromassilibacillus sp.]